MARFNRRIMLHMTAYLMLLYVMTTGCARREESSKPLPQKPYEIRLISRSFIPKQGIEDTLAQVLNTTEKARIHALIQFWNTLSPDDHKLLHESDIFLQGYLGGNSYTVSLPRGTVLDAGDLEKMVRWAGTFKPEDKLREPLLLKQFEEWAVDSLSGKIKLLVQFFPDIDREIVIRDLGSLDLRGVRYGANNSWSVLAYPEDITRLIQLESVRIIEQGPPPPEPLNESGRRVANSGEAQQATWNNPQPAYNKMSGVGVRIGICDTGVDENHSDFDQITAAGNPGASRIYNPRPGSGYHGTHVAGIAAGNGFNSTNMGFQPAFSLRGHAPQAMIGDYWQFQGNAQLYHDAIVNDNTNVSNHSYVQSHTIYDNTAVSLDMIIRGDAVDNNGNPIPAAPQVWASGNNGTCSQWGNEEGYYSVFTSAKNTISVGSVDTRDGRLSEFSSRGPTFDGRIKPDVVAPGCFDSVLELGCYVPGAPDDDGIFSTDNNTQNYLSLSGTSMAAPVVSGVIALMMEEFQNTYGQVSTFLPSMYKAILIHTAVDLVKTEAYASREFNDPDMNGPVIYHAGPDFTTGYGLVDADAAREKVIESAQWLAGTIGATNQTNTYCISVPQGSDELKVVIAWDDEPGIIGNETQSKLVNDLDLVLIDPNGNQYLPWTLDPLPLTANPGGGALDPITTNDIQPAFRDVDHRNNIEMASVPLPANGTWKAKISGFDLPNGNAQPFSLVSSHDIVLCLASVFEICVQFPFLCEDFFWIPEFDYFDTTWVVPAWSPVIPIDEICKYVLDCPGCEGFGWSYCPDWRMDIGHIPKDATITIFNQNGNIILVDDDPKTSRTIKIERTLPGDRYFILITNPKEVPYEDELRLKINLVSM